MAAVGGLSKGGKVASPKAVALMMSAPPWTT